MTKAEEFFIQLTYCLAIEPESMIQTNKGLISLLLEPSVFSQLLRDYKIEYPFFYENKIIELKTLMVNENIDSNDALIIIENYRNQYWFFDSVIMFEPLTDLLKQAIKSVNTQITEQEINEEITQFQKYLNDKRNMIFGKLKTKISEQARPLPQKIKVVNGKSEVGKTPNPKQRKVLKLIVEEMKKGTQKTDAINDSYQKAGYQDVRQVWTIVGKVEKGELLFNELTEVFKNN